jgi:hypothetical protein
MSDTTKSIVISGAAAESYLTGGKTRRKRTQQRGGQQVPSEVQETISETDKMIKLDQGPKVNSSKVAIIKKEEVSLPPPAPTPAPTPIESQSVLLGGAKKKIPVKVVLEKTKKAKEKVVLAAAKPKILKDPGFAKKKTLKSARRIRVSLDGLSRRIHRAKTIKKETEKTPLEEIKRRLQQAGLIKKDSKAPEAILRQMYIDFEQLKQRAL